MNFKSRNEMNEVEQIPFMPTPTTDIEYKMNWWKSKSISGVEDKGGSFDLELYISYLKCRRNRDY